MIIKGTTQWEYEYVGEGKSANKCKVCGDPISKNARHCYWCAQWMRWKIKEQFAMLKECKRRNDARRAIEARYQAGAASIKG